MRPCWLNDVENIWRAPMVNPRLKSASEFLNFSGKKDPVKIIIFSPFDIGNKMEK